MLTKYGSLLAISWKDGSVYRTSLALWRLRQFLSSVMALSVWTVLFSTSGSFKQYTQPEMITYIFLVAILQNIILSSVLMSLPQVVYSGKMSSDLVKPVNIYVFFAMKEVADKLKNVFFIILESLLLFWLYQPSIVWPSAFTFGVVLVMVGLATVLNFFISLLFGSLGFWSPDTWAPRFIYFMFIEFTAGRLFPLDILPTMLQKIIAFTPFPYFSFIQTQLFLGKLPADQILWHLAVLTGWVIGLGALTLTIWHHGLKDYSAAGH